MTNEITREELLRRVRMTRDSLKSAEGALRTVEHEHPEVRIMKLPELMEALADLFSNIELELEK